MRYWVYTRPYDGSEFTSSPPGDYGSDVVEVEATSKREALVLGLRALRQQQSRWIRAMESDKHNPFTGLKAEEDEA